MTVALSWQASGVPSAIPLAPGRRVVVGRSPDVDVVIDDPTVSRQHVAITAGASPGTSQLEHLSATNPTLVEGSPVQGVMRLADGAVIRLGDTTVTFHDLRARDSVSGPVCHVCGRENTDTDRDCWFCGTSLLNAPTTLRELRPVLLRVVSANGTWADLYSGRSIGLRPDGVLDTLRAHPPADVIAIHVVDGRPALTGPNAGDGPSDELATGAKLTAGDAQFVLIASEGSAAR